MHGRLRIAVAELFLFRETDQSLVDYGSQERVAIVKKMFAGSAIRGWEDQLSLVLDCEAVPNVAEVAWCITTYKAVRGIRLFPNMFVRTSSRDSNGSHVCFGNDTRNGGSLTIYPWSDTHRSESVSLATVRNKF
jgi:hypothetical protein